MNGSVFLSNLHYFCAQTDGAYKFPNSAEGDLLKRAKIEVEALQRENLSLREDKERLIELLKQWERVVDDCHKEMNDTGFGEYHVTAGLICDTRAAIDAARAKEGKK